MVKVGDPTIIGAWKPEGFGIYTYCGSVQKLDGRVLRFECTKTGKERLICEEWWLANGGESVEEVLEAGDEEDAGG